MTRFLRRSTRSLAVALLASSLFFCAPVRHEARAQPPGEEEASTESKGRPYDGYIATCTLMGLALFIVGKSARR